MTINLLAKPSGTQGALQLNGVDAVVFDATGIVSGVNKSAVSQMPTLGTVQATTSGTALDFTGIPSWVKRITVMLNGVSTNGASLVLVQLGSGAVQTTGYSCSCGYFSSGSSSAIQTNTAGFQTIGGSAATNRAGVLQFTLVGANLWVCNGNNYDNSGGYCSVINGAVTLSGALDRVRLTTANGTDTFDAGSWNILYE